MKNIFKSYFPLLIFSLIIISSCSKPPIESPEPVVVVEGGLPDLIQMYNNIHFKKDFITYNPYGKDDTPHEKSPMIFNQLKKASNSHKEKTKYYFEIKNDIEELRNSKDVKFHSAVMQSIALRYLRYCFLEEDSESALVETEYLLDVLVDLKARDIDVLVDAYAKIENIVDEDKKIKYLTHLLNVFAQEKKFVSDNSLFLKEQYENSGEKEKMELLVNGKMLERISKSISYAEEKMEDIAVRN